MCDYTFSNVNNIVLHNKIFKKSRIITQFMMYKYLLLEYQILLIKIRLQYWRAVALARMLSMILTARSFLLQPHTSRKLCWTVQLYLKQCHITFELIVAKMARWECFHFLIYSIFNLYQLRIIMCILYVYII